MAQQSASSLGSLRHERPKSRPEWWPQPLRSGWLVGRGLRRSERLRHRNRQNSFQHDRSRQPRRRGSDAHPSRRSDSALLLARSRWPAPWLDQTHEAHYPHSGLALQCRSHGHGLHAEVLRPRSRRNLKRSESESLRGGEEPGWYGGEGGIRTPGTLSGTPVFKTGAINHSATSPHFKTTTYQHYQRHLSNIF